MNVQIIKLNNLIIITKMLKRMKKKIKAFNLIINQTSKIYKSKFKILLTMSKKLLNLNSK